MSETIKVTWIANGSDVLSVQVAVGQSLMEAAVANNVPGITGDCGGALACATCHVVVEHSPIELAAKSSPEAEMLEFTDVPASAGSRLSCQIRASKELDGIVLRVPTA